MCPTCADECTEWKTDFSTPGKTLYANSSHFTHISCLEFCCVCFLTVKTTDIPKKDLLEGTLVGEGEVGGGCGEGTAKHYFPPAE